MILGQTIRFGRKVGDPLQQKTHIIILVAYSGENSMACRRTGSC